MLGNVRERKERDSVRSALRAFSIVGLFSSTRSEMTMKEIAEKLDLPSSTTVRLVQTLEGAGYIRKCDNGRYAPGGRLLAIAAAIMHSKGIVDLVRPHLEALRDATGETVCFADLAGESEVVYLQQCDSPHSIRHVRWVGQRIPISGTAIGAALTGECAPGEANISRSTYEKNVTAVAAPIHRHDGKIVGAINITGPSFRITDADLPMMSRLLLGEISEIEKKL